MRFVILALLLAAACSSSRTLGTLDPVDDDGGSDAGGSDAGIVPSPPVGATCAGLAQCLDPCGANEQCFTQVACGATMGDAAPFCSRPAQGPGDDRCHRRCDQGQACAAGEECQSLQFFGCTDFNGPHRICVAR